MRQAMPRALVQTRGDRVRAVVGIAIGVNDGFLRRVPQDWRVAAYLSDRHGSDFDEADPELGQRLVRNPVGIKRAAQANGALDRNTG
ncbi:hypothetical protein [Paenibacillus sp. yr247]|uniref:hypothetical protein n=1 Tax=Paenibacillus sp. yr247 TaxID=1761880 RepID=UPI0020C8B009|nr:hypothetical protein [Paenibacillus sp. yr247]